MIQDNINALLTMGAVAARTSATYQRNVAIKDTQTQIAGNARIMESDQEVDPKLFKEDPAQFRDILERRVKHAETRLDLDERMAGLDPNRYNATEQSESMAYLQSERELYRQALQAAQMEEMESARNSRTAFEDMRKMIGGNN